MYISVQAKHLERETGGNATYARQLVHGLRARPGLVVSTFASARPGRARQVSRALAEAAPDLANRHQRSSILHYTGDTGPLLAPRGCRVVTTVHGYAQGHVAGVRRPALAALWRARTRRAVSVSSRIITVSRSSADDLVRFLGAESRTIDVIHSGIDHERFNTEALSDAERLGFLDGPPYVLYVGNIEPRKNLPRAISAFNRSSLPALGWHFLIAGRPAWLAAESMQAIEAAGDSVRYLGQVAADVVAPLMAGSRAFLFPSLYEGFGFPPLEAMACGSPVVVSDRGALGEVTAGCGVTVDPLCVDDMATAIDRVCLTSLREELIEQGLSLVRTYTWDRCVDEHLQSYQAALA